MKYKPVVYNDRAESGKHAMWENPFLSCKLTRHSKLLLGCPVSSGSWSPLERKLVGVTLHETMSLQTLVPQNLHRHPHVELQTCLELSSFDLQSTHLVRRKSMHQSIHTYNKKKKRSFSILNYSRIQIQCGRCTSSIFPAVTVMSSSGPAGM